jgi:hypothetical protein
MRGKIVSSLCLSGLLKANFDRFHFCSLLLDAVERCNDSTRIDQMLELLPNNTRQIFARALQEIRQGPDKHCYIILLQLLLLAEPITLKEATDALSVKLAELFPFAPHYRRQLDPYKIVDGGLRLLEYVGSSSKFMLAHSTIREYLLSDDVDERYKAHLQGTKAKSTIVETCLGYLGSLPSYDDRSETLGLYPFAGYAAREWIKQAREVA